MIYPFKHRLGTDLQSTNLILLINDTCTIYDNVCLKELIFSILLLIVANLCNLQFFANIF